MPRLPMLAALLCAMVSTGRTQVDLQIPSALDQFNLPGDYLIGGFFGIHLASLDPGSKTLPVSVPCTSFNIPGFRRFQAMRFAVDEINNSSTLLPGVRLGYRIFDVCSESAAVMAILEASCGGPRCTVPVLRNYTEYSPQFIGVVGPHSSDAAVTIARALAFYSIPVSLLHQSGCSQSVKNYFDGEIAALKVQVSYGASSEILAQKNRYPSFFRTIPNDWNQAKAQALLVKHFKWHWIAVLGSDSQYGRQGVDRFISLAPKFGICVAYKAHIPKEGIGNPFMGTSVTPKVKEIVSQLSRSAVNVTLLFSEPEYLQMFFSIVIEQNITGKVWVASESWVQSMHISLIDNIHSIGTVLGIAVKQVLMPGFKSFISRALDSTGQVHGDVLPISYFGLEEHQVSGGLFQRGCYQNCHKCNTLTLDDLPLIWSPPERRKSFTSYAAVYALAQGLHRLLDCNLDKCNTSNNVFPWQLLRELKNINFTLNGQPIYFDENGDPPTGYEILAWDWTNQGASFQTIGQYEPLNGDLTINDSLIKWDRNKIPVSECSPHCQPGQIKRLKGYHSCCFDCEDCPGGTYQNADQEKCLECHQDQWSLPKSEACSKRTVVYLAWPDPVACTVSALGILGLIIIVGTVFIFKTHQDTPVVKAAGGKLCYLMLSSLTVTYISMGLFVSKPAAILCKIRQPLFAVSFAACVSCILVRSFQIVCIFKMAARLPKAYDYWVKYNGQYIFIATASCIQATICILWMLFDTSVLHSDYEFSYQEIYLGCKEGNLIGFGVMLCYNSLLCVVCFMFAFMGKNLPKNYNEAKCITISMLAYFISWIFFILTYSTARGKYVPAFQVVAVLSSSYGILGAYFFPKCYIILFQPKNNTTAYFQTCIQMYTTKKREEVD
ncbi:taste receptor type 1 member 1-like [Pleurodeles waltl]|uniref:taste receptor type 1 member 1-like n=1 Tax=Pleurodeles waltl TaxID=8319 RepID=UPI0037096E94